MTYGEFVGMLESFLGKKGLSDRIHWFVELAKRDLERRHDFAFTRREWETTYVEGGVPLPSDFKTVCGNQPVSVNGRLVEFTSEARELSDPGYSWQRAYIKPDGKLVLVPSLPGATVRLRYYARLPRYVSEAEEDFILKYAPDVLLWATLMVANFYLFEEDRVPLDEAAFEKALKSLMELDERFNLPAIE